MCKIGLSFWRSCGVILFVWLVGGWACEPGLSSEPNVGAEPTLHTEPTIQTQEPITTADKRAKEGVTGGERPVVSEMPDVGQGEPLAEPVSDAAGEPLLPEGSLPEPVQELLPEPPPDKGPQRVSMFVAVGSGMRSLISCDDGNTWISNQYQFWQGAGYDYSHSEWVNHGLSVSGDALVHFMGWGTKRTGRIWRSLDGVNWKTTLDTSDPKDPHYDAKKREVFWNGAAGGGVVVAGAGTTVRRSTDDGQTWSAKLVVYDKKTQPALSHARFAYVSVKNKPYFFAWGDANKAKDAVGDALYTGYYSADQGKTWKVSKIPKQFKWCATQARVASGGGMILMIARPIGNATTGRPDGAVCRSSDGGASWTYLGSAGFRYPNQMLWTGSHFRVYLRRQVFETKDGKSWQERKPVSGLDTFRAISYNPKTGVYVAHGSPNNYSSGWFARSKDGLSWTRLAETAYPSQGNNGPAIGSIVHFMGLPSKGCP